MRESLVAAPPLTRMKACLNGSRAQHEHPAVAVTPAGLAQAASDAVASGAEAVHIHPRAVDGAESLLAADIGAAVAAVRQACPQTPVGVSTGLWITGRGTAARQAAVSGWTDLPSAARPDFASVNMSEHGSADLAELLHSLKIKAEAGVWSPADARTAAAVCPADGWLRILVEVMDTRTAGADEQADQILRELDAHGMAAVPRLVHGEGEACWPLVAYAGRLGLPTRIGLEDTTTGPDGEPVAGNGELVHLALAIWTAAARH